MEKFFETVIKIICVGLVIWAVIVFFLEIGYRPINKVLNERTITVTVTKMEVKRIHGADKYLIFTTDEDGDMQVFEITDSLWKGRWDSSDLYGSIETKKTYKFTVCGSRWKLMSWYPNIYKATEVK